MISPSARRKAVSALRLLRRFGAPHWRWSAAGWLATLFIVASRLAMPWPLRRIIEVASAADPAGGNGGNDWLQPTLGFVAAYIVIAVVLGYSELRQRVSFKRYAARTVHGLREAAVATLRAGPTRKKTPDLISRIIGDCARVKAEMSGILVHVSQNGLLFVGICGIFLVLSPTLAAFFLIGGVYAIVVGYRVTSRVEAITTAQREKEAQYASYVNDLVDHGLDSKRGAEINATSARDDITATHLIARSTWLVHTGLSVITGCALLVSMHEVQHGRLELGEMFLFIAYVLIAHRRLIQLGRQVGRGGKMVANVNRVGELLEPNSTPQEDDLPPLHESFELALLETGYTGVSSEGGPRVRLEFPRGSRTVLVASDGSGTRLLERMAGESDDGAEVLWDSKSVAPSALRASQQVVYVSRTPNFPARKLSWFIDHRTRLKSDTARALGLRRFVREQPQGLKTRISSDAISPARSQALTLGRLLWGGEGSVWLIDQPMCGVRADKVERTVGAILDHLGMRTLIMALPNVISAERFDRLIVMEEDRIVFDGPPLSWTEACATMPGGSTAHA
jgi:ATP-binding cassette, subfamily B, bacterial